MTNQPDMTLDEARYWLRQPWRAARRLTGQDFADLRRALGVSDAEASRQCGAVGPRTRLLRFGPRLWIAMSRVEASPGRVGFVAVWRYLRMIRVWGGEEAG